MEVTRKESIRRVKKSSLLTYYLHLSFFVVCKEKEYETYIKSLIKTVIIEQGRE